MKQFSFLCVFLLLSSVMVSAQDAQGEPLTTDEPYYIFFEAWTSKITDDGLSIPKLHDVSTTLSAVLKFLQDNPNYRMLIEGFANPVTGTKAEEVELQRLSTERAKETENKFVRDGISRSRFVSLGEGGISDPYDKSALQQAKNRRVQMTVINENSPAFRVNFRTEYAVIVARQFYAQEQIDALQQIRRATEYIKSNPNTRVLVQGFEASQEVGVQRSAPISKQRADEVARLLRRELENEGIGNVKIAVVTNTNERDTAAEILMLAPVSAELR